MEMFGSWSKKNPPQKVSHKDKIHFYGSDSTRNGGYALTPMPWTGPAPRTRTGRGLQDLSPPTYVVQGQPTVCASSRRSPMCFAFSTHWLRSALAFGPSSNLGGNLLPNTLVDDKGGVPGEFGLHNMSSGGLRFRKKRLEPRKRLESLHTAQGLPSDAVDLL